MAISAVAGKRAKPGVCQLLVCQLMSMPDNLGPRSTISRLMSNVGASLQTALQPQGVNPALLCSTYNRLQQLLCHMKHVGQGAAECLPSTVRLQTIESAHCPSAPVPHTKRHSNPCRADNALFTASTLPASCYCLFVPLHCYCVATSNQEAPAS